MLNLILVAIILVEIHELVDPATNWIVESVTSGNTYDLTKNNTGPTTVDTKVNCVALKPNVFLSGGTALEIASIMVNVLSKHNAGR